MRQIVVDVPFRQYNGEKVAQGRDNAVKYLENNPAIADEIESKIREKLGVK